jgi:hypothetical protein
MMALTNAYVQVYGKLGEVFNKLAQAQAPEKFTVQYLKDLGFGSSNYRALIPLLKGLGFLSVDGLPTQRYHEYRNSALSKRVMGAAIRDSYGDIFTISAAPTANDRKLIEGKFKSQHNVSNNTAKLMASTFFSLLDLADLSLADKRELDKKEGAPKDHKEPTPRALKALTDVPSLPRAASRPNLHYNIQIHLPATKDVEVFNAIFKSLKEHLFE